MALSEREQKLLAQMEQALYAEDPRFATKIKTQGLGRSKRRVMVGVLAILLGLGLVLVAVLNQLVWMGAVGFGVMVAGAVWGFTAETGRGVVGTVADDGAVQPTGARTSSKSRQSRGPKGRSGFMERLEQRWERRNRDQW